MNKILELIRPYYLKLPKVYKNKVRRIYEFYLHLVAALKWVPRNIHSIYVFSKYKDKFVRDFNSFERKVFSQNGEDGIIEIIFHKIGVTNKYCVEFGVENGKECNTRYLITRYGWNYLHMDAGDDLPPTVKSEFVTSKNVNRLFSKYNVPAEFDLLSIDIDSHDYWVWKALTDYTPRVVVIEYNSAIPVHESRVLKPNVEVLEKYPRSFGASLSALTKLGKEKGYTLVTCDNRGVNAFFVRNNCINNSFKVNTIEEIYRPPQYGNKVDGKYVGFFPDSGAMIEV